jgi:hypothetical protein
MWSRKYNSGGAPINSPGAIHMYPHNHNDKLGKSRVETVQGVGDDQMETSMKVNFRLTEKFRILVDYMWQG